MEEQTISTSKQAILDAAQDLLARHGYAGLSMRELALESRLAKATIYHYFQDKEEIFRQVLERDMHTAHDHVVAAMAKEAGCVAKLRAAIYAYFSLMHARRAIIMSVMREIGENKPLLRDMMCHNRNLHLGPLMKLIQQGIDEGIFRPVNVEYTTYSLLGMINAFVIFQFYQSEATINGANSTVVNPIDSQFDRNSAGGSGEEVAEHTLQLILQGLQTAAPIQNAPS
jgi:TetR/AcrR family transcriptional regulator, cholesterol catabolism regulator